MPLAASKVVLMLGRLLRLRLDKKLALEANRFGMIDREMKETCEVVLLAFSDLYSEASRSLPDRPRNVIFAAKLFSWLRAPS